MGCGAQTLSRLSILAESGVRLIRLEWLREVVIGVSLAANLLQRGFFGRWRFGGSRAAMHGCGVGGTTACAGMKQEWGLMSAADFLVAGRVFFPSFGFPPSLAGPFSGRGER